MPRLTGILDAQITLTDGVFWRQLLSIGSAAAGAPLLQGKSIYTFFKHLRQEPVIVVG